MSSSTLNIQEIDVFLQRLDSAVDDDELRSLFEEYNAQYDLDVPPDPFSSDYREKQFAIYEFLSGRSYNIQNEKTLFDVEAAAISPFPYNHRSSETVGNQLLAIGFLIKVMALPPNARILEFGPGWGNTTLILAKMGYRVTAVDIEPNFVELIQRRAAMENLEVDVVLGDFSIIKDFDKSFDAILFFECFHHASDHLSLMSDFESVVERGGLVCFGAEPITNDFPIPWGLRMDGQSLWAIRKNGWLELGFNREYFNGALRRYGWITEEKTGHDGPWSNVVIARRLSEMVLLYDFQDGGLRHQIGTRTNLGIEVNEREVGYVAYGPYQRLNAGSWIASLLVVPTTKLQGKIVFDVVDAGTGRVIAEQTFNLDRKTEMQDIEITFSLDQAVQSFEARVFCEEGGRLHIKGVELRPD